MTEKLVFHDCKEMLKEIERCERSYIYRRITYLERCYKFEITNSFANGLFLNGFEEMEIQNNLIEANEAWVAYNKLYNDLHNKLDALHKAQTFGRLDEELYEEETK